MKTTADRYREAGMSDPRPEAYIPTGTAPRHRTAEILRDAQRTIPNHPLAERGHDPATKPDPPEIDPAADGADLEPLDNPDADHTEEIS